MAERNFDISWISGKTGAAGAPAKRWEEDSYSVRGYGYSRGSGGGGGFASRGGEGYGGLMIDPLECAVLGAFRNSPQERLHVVDLAARVGIEFDDALKAVLRLAARREVGILERDPVANDHVVQLTPAGLEALKKR